VVPILFQIPALQTPVVIIVAGVVFGPFYFLLVAFLVTFCFYRKAGALWLAQWSVIAPAILASHVGVGELFEAVGLAENWLDSLAWSIVWASASIGTMLATAYAVKAFVWGKGMPFGSINARHLIGSVAAFGALLISVQPLHGLTVRLAGLGEPLQGLEAAFRRSHMIQAVYHGWNCAVIVLAVLIMVLLILKKAHSAQRMAGVATLGVWVVAAICTEYFGVGVLGLGYGALIWAGLAAIFAGALAVFYAKYVVGRQVRRL